MKQLLRLIREHRKTYCRSVQLSHTADNPIATQWCGTLHSDGGTLIPALALLLLISLIRVEIIIFWIVYNLQSQEATPSSSLWTVPLSAVKFSQWMPYIETSCSYTQHQNFDFLWFDGLVLSCCYSVPVPHITEYTAHRWLHVLPAAIIFIPIMRCHSWVPYGI